VLKFYTDAQNNRIIYEIFIFSVMFCDMTHTSLKAEIRSAESRFSEKYIYKINTFTIK